MTDKVVLAYSGGLETSICIHWLRHKRNLKVVTCTAELGGGQTLQPLAENALDAGAAAAHISDLRERFVEHFVRPALLANARYEGEYYLGTALSRPLIAAELVRIATEENCRYVAHGATLDGNDPARFEVAISSLAPRFEVIHPPSEWGDNSREALLEYAARYRIPYLLRDEKGYSTDINLWGAATAQGPVADPWLEPPGSAYVMTTDPRLAPDEPDEIELGFLAGLPIALDGRRMPLIEIVRRLNEQGGAHGVGRFDCIENRYTSIKTREIYEAPAATILVGCHEALEDLTLSKELTQFKELLSARYAELIYSGRWYCTLRESLDAFFAASQASVSGDVRMRLYKGRATVIGRRSEYSLYDEQQASGLSRHAQAFLKMISLPNRAEAVQKQIRQAHEESGEMPTHARPAGTRRSG